MTLSDDDDLDCERSDVDDSTSVVDVGAEAVRGAPSPAAAVGASSCVDHGDDADGSNHDDQLCQIIRRSLDALRQLQPVIWRMFEKPYSSKAAKVNQRRN